MPLHLVAPGKRKKKRNGKVYRNPFYLIRGTIDGREFEVSTDTGDKADAERIKAAFEHRVRSSRVPGSDETVTFGAALEFYVAFRSPKKGDARRIRRLKIVMGQKPVADVQHADLVAAAEQLYPGRKNETKNRWVMKPAAAILHYAATNKWRDWLRVEKLAEGPIVTRAASEAAALAILGALDGELARAKTEHKRHRARKKRLLVLWLMKHGNRVSDPLRLKWDEHIALPRKVYLIFVGKGNVWKEKPLDEEVFEALANDPDKKGWVFPWRTRSGVYKWLRPLCRKLKVTFTPHMARHFVGKRLNATGAGLKTIMGALDHADPQSSVRYQDADLEVVRGALKKAGKLRRMRR
jgi:integrase